MKYPGLKIRTSDGRAVRQQQDGSREADHFLFHDGPCGWRQVIRFDLRNKRVLAKGVSMDFAERISMATLLLLPLQDRACTVL